MNALVTEAAPLTPTERTARLVEFLERQCGLKRSDKPISDSNLALSKPALKATKSQPNSDLALRVLTEATAPASDTQLDAAFARIAAMCKRFTAGDDFNADLQLAEYRAGCRAYPADVALFVLNRWPGRHDEWPAWKALKDEFDAEFAPRRMLMEALKQVEPFDPPSESGPTEADIADVRAIRDRTIAKLKAASQQAGKAYATPKERTVLKPELSPGAEAHLKRVAHNRPPMEH